jgi:DnaJ-class molecular chaperone
MPTIHSMRPQRRRTEARRRMKTLVPGNAEQDKESPPRLWWETLNVDENASPEQIKSAFRKEISKYHPDRVEGLE